MRRLWHHLLIPHLDEYLLLDLHRFCCYLRGEWWGNKQLGVDYIFAYPPSKLYAYHRRVMEEITRRFGDIIAPEWYARLHRGSSLKGMEPWSATTEFGMDNDPKYPEHDFGYFGECLDVLRENHLLGENDGWLRVGRGRPFKLSKIIAEDFTAKD